MAAEARATGRRAAEEVRATTRGRDPGRRRGGREPTCSLAHAYYLRGVAIPPPQFTSRLLSHHSPLPSRLLESLPLLPPSSLPCPGSSLCFYVPHFSGTLQRITPLGIAVHVCSTISTSDSLQGEGGPK